MSKLIAESAKIGENVKLGHNVIIEEDVVIGENCIIGHNVIIKEKTTLGSFCRIDDNSIIGKQPMRSPRSIFKESKKLSPAIIGDSCLLGANVIIYAQAQIGNNNLIADLATIRENVEIGNYNIIGRNAAIENYVRIKNRNKFETNCYITAYSDIGSYCFVAPGVLTSNDNYIGRDKERYKHFKGITMSDGARIGVGSIVLPGKTLKKDSVSAGGSVVTKDLPDKEIWLGAPAKYFSKVPEKQLMKNNLDKEDKK